MIKRFSLLILITLPLFASSQQKLKLWYKQPAEEWTAALPIGNGRLGAMVFGGVNEEHIQLNESTLWSGGPVKTHINPDAPKYLAGVRAALLQNENYEEAVRLEKKMQGLYTESYLPLGDLFIRQQTGSNPVTNYYRELDISRAVATTTFTSSAVTYTRQVFSSAPDQVIVIRFTASKPGQLSLKISSTTLLQHQGYANGKNGFILSGKAPSHVDPVYYHPNNHPVTYDLQNKCAGMPFQLTYKAINQGGTVSSDDTGITVKNATTVTLLVSAATGFKRFDLCPDNDAAKIAAGYLDKAVAKTFSTLLTAHTSDYQKYFNRVSLQLKSPVSSNKIDLPTNERILAYTKGAVDPDYETLFFQYGRYLLISSSRPRGTVANLQGIWNNELQPPWSSNYTININTQMNYWPAEVTNLSEMHEPVYGLVKALSITGKTTAKEFYGMKGWVAHHNSDIWAASNPVGDKGQGDPKWANYAMGGNWMCRDLWEHYLFTSDKNFLQKQAYPIMKGAAEFCLDWLVEDKNGYLVTVPSSSPENDFIDENGKKGEISVASTMDMSIIYDLFSNLIDAATVLNKDQDFKNLLIAKRAKLYPMHIGHAGNLQEWYKDFKDVDPQHRHVSHLFGLHPGKQISPIITPDLAAAARKTLAVRGDEGTGWSLAWKINFWARLLDGNHAHQLIRELLKANSKTQTDSHHGGGLYENMFDAHPPFQIDGNFGGTAGMAEMLVQSQQAEIHLLPALPDTWSSGEVKGLKARGDFEVQISWANHKLTKATILSVKGGDCIVRTAEKIMVKGVTAKTTSTTNGYLTSFASQKGQRYQITTVIP